MSGLLGSVKGPQDVKRLTAEELPQLAGEVRDLLVDACAKFGGHLGPNLGVVELTIALHRVFDSPRDRILWDTGHQAYVHKMLTGRAGGFDRAAAGGRPVRLPEPGRVRARHVENSHASTALSYADGLAKAFKLRGERDRTVVAVIGDGALTGGMAWEALNNIAAGKELPARHRGQRQRPLLLADDRRARRAPVVAADRPAATRTRWSTSDAGWSSVVGPSALRRAARRQEGHQGRPGPAGACSRTSA